MEMVKYILRSIVDALDAVSGKGSSGDVKMSIVGLLFTAVCVGSFSASLFIIGNKTNVKYPLVIFISILVTILVILIIFLVLIVVEAIFQ